MLKHHFEIEEFFHSEYEKLRTEKNGFEHFIHKKEILNLI